MMSSPAMASSCCFSQPQTCQAGRQARPGPIRGAGLGAAPSRAAPGRKPPSQLLPLWPWLAAAARPPSWWWGLRAKGQTALNCPASLLDTAQQANGGQSEVALIFVFCVWFVFLTSAPFNRPWFTILVKLCWGWAQLCADLPWRKTAACFNGGLLVIFPPPFSTVVCNGGRASKCPQEGLYLAEGMSQLMVWCGLFDQSRLNNGLGKPRK